MDPGRLYEAAAAAAAGTPEACAAQAALSAVHEPGSLPTTTRWRRISTVPILPGEKLRLKVKLATVTQLVNGETPVQMWAVWLLCAFKLCVTLASRVEV